MVDSDKNANSHSKEEVVKKKHSEEEVKLKEEHKKEEEEIKEEHHEYEDELEEEYKKEEEKVKEEHNIDELESKEKDKQEEKELHDKHLIEEKKLHEKHKFEEKKLHERQKAEKEPGSTFKHKPAAKKNLMKTLKDNSDLIFIGAIILVIILVIFLKPVIFPGGAGNTTTTGLTGTGGEGSTVGSEYGVVNLEFYVMSQCPYGTQVEDGIAPVLKSLGGAVNFSLYFIGRLEGTKFNSLHGEPEVQGDMVQACAAKYNPDKYMDMIVCMNKDAKSIPGNWKTCAEDNGLDVNSINTCYTGEEGIELLKASFAAATAKQATGSPTIYLDGVQYSGGRDALSFQRALCQKLEGHPECGTMPACGTDQDCQQPGKVGKCLNPGTSDAKCNYTNPVRTDVIVLNDARCKDCDVSRVMPQLSSMFPGMVMRSLDYSTDEGKALYDSAGIKALPAVLFDENVVNTNSYKQISAYLEPKGEYLSLAIGASYDPSKEVCDNNKDDTGNGKVDCDDEDCAGVWECVRKSDKPEVEVFVMSHCPYGTQVEKGILPVAELLGDKADIKVKFVNYAMHGEKEVVEEITQYCIQKEMPDQYWAYLKCFLGSTSGSKAEGDKCIADLGLDTTVIKTCYDATDTEFSIMTDFADKSTWKGNYASFSISDAENQKYGIRGSPSLRINGAEPTAGRDAKSLLAAVCLAFENQPDECNTDLSSEGNPGPGFGFGQASASSASAAAGCGA